VFLINSWVCSPDSKQVSSTKQKSLLDFFNLHFSEL
jgi:hypothetical protein